MSHRPRPRRARASNSDVSTKLTYFVIGGTVGAVVALLFAPKSGRELREDLADATRKGVDVTREKAGEYYEVAASRAGDLAGAAREAAARRGERLSAAIEEGRRAYQSEKRRTEQDSLTPAPGYLSGGQG